MDVIMEVAAEVDDHGTVKLWFSYDKAKPYEVLMIVTAPTTKQEVPWILSRDMLSVGRRRRVGIGDVTVRPYYADPDDFSRPGCVHIHLESDDGECDIRFPVEALDGFIKDTEALVRPGAESEHLDLDRGLADWLCRPRSVDAGQGEAAGEGESP